LITVGADQVLASITDPAPVQRRRIVFASRSANAASGSPPSSASDEK
jgi:hypothetical protein